MKAVDFSMISEVHHSDWRTALLGPGATLREAIRNLEATGLQIVLVVSPTNELLGTVTDGDIRRSLLHGNDLETRVDVVMRHSPVVAPPDMSRQLVLQLMQANRLLQLPVVDAARTLVGLHLWDDVIAPKQRDHVMVVMAGGLGKRMRPFTEDCPKPMLPIAGKPMLEHIIESAKKEGFVRFVFAVRYLSHVIKEYFGNGEPWGVRIDYLHEEEPLGTAGALSLLDALPGDLPFVVTNGDVLTDIRYGEMVDFHLRHGAEGTMAVRQHEWQHPFGVVRTDGVNIVGFEEKPVHRTHVNAGIYVLGGAALTLLNRAENCDMPTLFERMQAHQKKVIAYPMHEPWLDVGRPDDLPKAHAFKTEAAEK
jgi:dTDP-glucose pyrophosphorylase/predicted transcriptional regulator